MGDWAWWIGGGLLGVVAAPVSACAGAYWYYRAKHLQQIVRIFEEKPLFVIPRGQPMAGAEETAFETTDGLTLRGCYLASRTPRKGVILFGLEFGSNRWSCVPYCSALLDRGYDVFAYEPRNQGDSDKDANYRPLQWVTRHDVDDMTAAIRYLKRRKDAAANIGILGVSKGGSVGLQVAATEPWVKCVATDGAYGTYTTMIPYMRRWVSIYVKRSQAVRDLIPDWFYGAIGQAAVRESARQRGVEFVSLERALRQFRKPLFMVHGAADTYIKADMAEAILKRAATRDKLLWLVAGAKHNQARDRAGDDYTKKLAAFFDAHLATSAAELRPTSEDSTTLPFRRAG